MTTKDSTERVLSRWDASGIWFFIAAGAAFAIWTVVTAVVRIIEVIPNSDVKVFAQFSGTPAQAPIGPDGAPVTVELDTAFLIAPQLPVASVVALVLEQVVVIVTVLTVVTALVLLMWHILRGRIFSRRNTVLVGTATFTGLVGMALAPFFGNMGANGAFAWISDRTFENVILTVDLVQLFAVALIGSVALTAFTVGARLQRDTQGLV